jgi:two-component system response regulator CpxR
MRKKLLLIDKDVELTNQLSHHLDIESFDVEVFNDEARGLIEAQKNQYDIILLDIVTSKLDGFKLLEGLRETSDCPIVVMTSRDDHFDHIYSLEIGADDYLLKPIHQRVLLAHIKAIIRRLSHLKEKKQAYKLSLNNIFLCQSTRESYCNGEVLDLTAIEFGVLFFLMSHAGKILSKESIASYVLGRTISYYDRCIEMHISNIRKKISLISADEGNSKIKTIRGSGYIFLPQHYGNVHQSEEFLKAE